MLKVILNRLKPQAEMINVEERAESKAGRSTTEQIFKLKIFSLQHQPDLYHVFIDYKNAFDRVWHAALWATIRKFNLVKIWSSPYNSCMTDLQRSTPQCEIRWLVQNHSWSQARVPPVTNSIQHLLGKNHVWGLEKHKGAVSGERRNITMDWKDLQRNPRT